VNRRYFAIALRAVAIVLLIVAAFRIAIAAMFGTSNPKPESDCGDKKSGVDFSSVGNISRPKRLLRKLTPDVTLAANRGAAGPD